MKKTSKIYIQTSSLLANSDQLFEHGVTETGIKDQIQKAVLQVHELSDDTLDLIATSIANISMRMVSKLNDHFKDNNPSSISIEYGVNLVAETSIEIVKASGEATFTVSIEWSKK